MDRLQIAKKIEADARQFYKRYTAGLEILDDDLRMLTGFGVHLHNTAADQSRVIAVLTGALDGWVGYHKALRGGQIVGCPGNGYGGSCTDSGGYPDGLDNANPSQICDFHKLLRSTHKALAEAQRIQEGK